MGEEDRLMKVAISSNGRTLDSEVSEFFGRCENFLIVETDGKKAEIVRNAPEGKVGGAGISAAKTVAEKGVKAAIAGNFGPNALGVLGQFGIGAFSGKGSVRDVLRDFSKGKLRKV
ncbi:MAG: NifB/NifX family molybdenum-iron cluster-binding protein [archaeon]